MIRTILGLVCGAAIAVSLPASVLPARVSLDLGGGVTMEFVLIPSGSFPMGSAEETGDADETPRHRVILSHAFYLGKHEVTQEQWIKLMGNNPSHFKGATLPVDTVSWNDCQQFLSRHREKTGHSCSLPTEAQWEYACPAGTTTKWNFGDTDAAVAEHAWTESNSGGTTHPVAQKKTNSWGFYDLQENLGEWCADWYANPYPKSDATDPLGPATGASRVVRGGAWGDHPNNARPAYRKCNGPTARTTASVSAACCRWRTWTPSALVRRNEIPRDFITRARARNHRSRGFFPAAQPPA